MASWLNRCPAWQFVLTLGGLVFVAAVVAGGMVQLLWHGHLNLSVLLGAAAGSTLGSVLMGAAWRVSRPGPR